MGGGGALWLALTRPDVWAAVAPVCAATIPGSEELAPNALNLPIRLFHGDARPAVPVASSRAWQRRLLDAGVPAEYIEYPGVAPQRLGLSPTANGGALRLVRDSSAATASRSACGWSPLLPLRFGLLGAHRRPDARRAGFHRRAPDRQDGGAVETSERRWLHARLGRPLGLPAS